MKLFYIISGLVLLLTGLSWQGQWSQNAIDPVKHFQRLYYGDFDEFKKQVESLVRVCHQEHDIPQIRYQLTKTRLSYKKIEFIFDYYHTYFNYMYINGGPLPKVHKEVSEIDVLPPNGLQTLDEMAYSDDADQETEQIKKLSLDLQSSVKLISVSHELLDMEEKELIEAIRSGLVRVFSLGLTGFDTPGSVNAIEEAKLSLKSMQSCFEVLVSELPHSKLNKTIQDLFLKGQNILASQKAFDQLDRMHFLKEVINPLYGKLLEYQLARGYSAENVKAQAQNFSATNLFEEEFLNTDFFSQFSFVPLSDPKAIELGKILFYDPILSKNVDLSCASCHHPDKAFSDGLPKSQSNTTGVFTKRNSPMLIDAGFASRYFWDMREYDLERQVAHVVEDNLEFNIGFPKIVKRLQQSREYKQLFSEVYQDHTEQIIQKRTISNAIAAYVSSLKSFNSPFDQYVRNEIADIEPGIIRGFNLFMGKAACGTCHFAPVFNGSVPPFFIESESEVLGVPVSFDTLNPVLDPDPGRYANGLHRDAHPHFKHSFKTVTVRNSALSAPYMHNGALNDLDELMDFYNRGGGAGMGIDIENQTLAPDPLNLTDTELADLVTFMHSLTDTSGLTSRIYDLPGFDDHPYWNDRNKPKIDD